MSAGAGGGKEEEETGAGEGLDAGVVEAGWRRVLSEEFAKPYFGEIETFLAEEERAKRKFFPPRPEIFTALNWTPFDQVRVVIVGQDPYHDDGQAHGLSFSVKPGVAIPGSLRNIYKELTADIPGFKAPSHGYLRAWAERGVLMLNATLTVQAHKPNSHAKATNWGTFTDAVIAKINAEHPGCVFLLWGGFAKKKAKGIAKKHRVISTAHPSPLSAKYWHGCKCFSKVNAALVALGHEEMDWSLPADPNQPLVKAARD